MSAVDDLIGDAIPTGRLFHFALAVPDLPAAMALLGPALNAEWTVVRPTTIVMETPAGPTSTDIDAVYSREGPPYVELVSGEPESYFSSADGPRLHHAGYIVDDVRVEAERLEALGMTIVGMGRGDPPGSAFVENELGLTLEVMAQGIRGTLDDWFAIRE